jgi:Kef-type K+ transport system membrane component KefB
MPIASSRGFDDATFFLIVVAVAALASLIATLSRPWVLLPVVVLELGLGIVVGPDILGWVEPDAFLTFFANLGLAMLFFFAGFEIDFERIRGEPLKLALIGWAISLALAYSIGGLLAWAGIVLSLLFTGTALVTTAIGTLIPIVADSGDLKTRFGSYLLAAGAVGELGPILLITVALSASNPAIELLVLTGFVVLAVLTALMTTKSLPRGWHILNSTLESTGQLAVRLTVAMVFALVALAATLGLDLLLGGFAAGVIVRLSLRDRSSAVYESKLMAVGYGFLIPFFFVVSGIEFNLHALTESTSALLRLPMFLALFLVVRGVPALIMYRSALGLRDRVALAMFSSTQLPLVVAITAVAVEQAHMSTVTAASLVGAAMLSTLIFPLIGMELRQGRLTDVERARA